VQDECKGIVTDVFAIVSWELNESQKNFAAAGLHLQTLTNFSSIIGLALNKGTISQAEWEKIIEFKKDPRSWFSKIS
jgi:orotate phosphoribosyltransferase